MLKAREVIRTYKERLGRRPSLRGAVAFCCGMPAARGDLARGPGNKYSQIPASLPPIHRSRPEAEAKEAHWRAHSQPPGQLAGCRRALNGSAGHVPAA